MHELRCTSDGLYGRLSAYIRSAKLLGQVLRKVYYGVRKVNQVHCLVLSWESAVVLRG